MNDPIESVWAMLAIEKYVAELRDRGLSAASAGFCGMVLRESLDIPDIQDAAEYDFYLNQVQKMDTHFDAETFNAAALTPMAVIVKLLTYKSLNPEVGDLPNLDPIAEFMKVLEDYSRRPRAESSNLIVPTAQVLQ